MQEPGKNTCKSILLADPTMRKELSCCISSMCFMHLYRATDQIREKQNESIPER